IPLSAKRWMTTDEFYCTSESNGATTRRSETDRRASGVSAKPGNTLAMPVDEETRRTLNMIRSSPDKAVLVRDKLNTIKIVAPAAIDAATGVFWLFGASELATGVEVESVFVIDTGQPPRPHAGKTGNDGAARLRTYYWWVLDNWYPQGDLSGLERLEIGEDEAFPFRWSTLIPLTVPVAAGPQHTAA
ncbi:MAG: hypothetical protein ACR2O4_12085, partial [Hyphomicrobiaceae bacterium]